MQKYMVIERFHAGNSIAIYNRFEKAGRMLPPGLFFVDSWLAEDDCTCFQIMETDDPSLFDRWTSNWNDLASFEIKKLKDKPTGNMT